MMGLLRRKKDKQSIDQKDIDGSVVAKNIQDDSTKVIHADTINIQTANFFVSEQSHFRGFKHLAKNMPTEKKMYDENDAIFSFLKPESDSVVEYNDLRPEVIALLNKYYELYSLLSNKDRAIFVCVCKLVAAEDVFTATEYKDESKNVEGFAETDLIKDIAESAYKDRFKRIYCDLRSDYIDNHIMPLIKDLKQKYKGEQLTNAFNVRWNETLSRNPIHVYTNKFTKTDNLIAELLGRLNAGAKTVSVFVRYEWAIDRTERALKENLGTAYKVTKKGRPPIAKVKTAVFEIEKTS